MKSLLNEVSAANAYSVVDTLGLRRRLGLLDHKWSGYGQEDAHEFLTLIISTLQVCPLIEITCSVTHLTGGLQQKHM